MIISTTGVIGAGDFEVHESIGVTTVIGVTAMPLSSAAMPTPRAALPSIDTVVHGTIETYDVPVSF